MENPPFVNELPIGNGEFLLLCWITGVYIPFLYTDGFFNTGSHQGSYYFPQTFVTLHFCVLIMLIRGPHLTEPGKSFPTKNIQTTFLVNWSLLAQPKHCKGVRKGWHKDVGPNLDTMNTVAVGCGWTNLTRDVRGAYRSIDVEHHPRVVWPKGQKNTIIGPEGRHLTTSFLSISTKKKRIKPQKKSCQNVQSHLPSPISHPQMKNPSSPSIPTPGTSCTCFKVGSTKEYATLSTKSLQSISGGWPSLLVVKTWVLTWLSWTYQVVRSSLECNYLRT